ncbi:uncharacterized protein LOC128307493 [Anopheles moucheti]|uniref:uncharacterized protein LOC128307493 n=1 Tax=Anopheles moucheti TaxID=186751 RepID=UPI0022F07F8B|nr:uncharacterized protein LOC128307493 [Anopheles moucheti]
MIKREAGTQPTAPGMKTRRLIPDISVWLSRKHGEVNFFLTQLLTGFLLSNFVEKAILDGSSNCPVCTNDVEDVSHVLFSCPRFARIQQEMQQRSRTRLTKENLGTEMCSDEDTWDAVRTAARAIFKTLQQLWNEVSPPTARRRRRQRRR